jgi:hypothetical protein
MKRLVLVLLLGVCASVNAQNRSSQLDQAYDEVRASYAALQQVLARRDQGIESLPGERTGSAAGGSRPNENYFARQAILEQEVELARKRYETALKRWNDLK